MSQKEVKTVSFRRGPKRGSFERPVQPAGVILKRLWNYLKPQFPLLLLAGLLSIIGNLIALVGPRISGRAIDAITDSGGVDYQNVFRFAGMMIVCYLVSGIMSYILSVLMIRISRKVVYSMRKDAFEKLLTLPVSFFDGHQPGDVISMISYDIETVNTSLTHDIVLMASSLITVVGSFIMMMIVSPLLVLIFVVTIPLAVLITRYRAKKVRPLYRNRSVKIGKMNGFVEENTAGLKTIRAYGREQEFIKRFDEKNNEAVDAYYEADRFACANGPIVNLINNISLAMISAFGALLYIRGGVTLGNISSFMLYSRKFSGPINEFANIISELQSALAAAERVFRLIDEDPEKADAKDAIEPEKVKGEIEARDVRFSYDLGREILHGISFSANSGKLVAIVGETGCGKTTLINLLMRFYDRDSGMITLDENPIESLKRARLRQSYTMVLQDAWLFHGTIYENIVYSRPSASREDVENAAKAAMIHGYIESLPKGYDTLLSDNAVNLSKGQKQLLTIARALLLDSPMLILDEATSNVDTQTEQRIQAAMLNLMKGRTCFVIAHRLSTIKNADEILVMDNGSIVERGTHRELLDNHGVYYGMYSSQFEAV
ncbi:MAG: ABC transporter ATP-binding protein [Clostridia bacterium]|nr:ABC transporter ATP-binding protein [Clostridia bacterium]